jgi:ubiquinone/menaquinone biosynthesis C-methylase UbiE
MQPTEAPALDHFPLYMDVRAIELSPKRYSAHPLVLATYGPNDLAKLPCFQGGYINFGYWKGIQLKEREITQEERVRASEALYDLVIDHLKIERKDSVLEVGCGRGNGCAKIVKTIEPQLVIGIDITPEQIVRAKRIHQNEGVEGTTLSFHVGSSDYIPFPDRHFTKIYSIEAAQCFPSMVNFAKEAWRVLKKGGKLAITAHFATGESGYQALRACIPTIDQGVDRLIPIENVRQAFLNVGFKEILFEPIGDHVFEGFHQWRLKVGDTKWVDSVFECYKEGHMDYYLILLEK